MFSLCVSDKPLKAVQSDHAIQPRFVIGTDVFLTPLTTPRNTVVVASQTRLDGPQHGLCRRSCRVISGPCLIVYTIGHRLVTCRDVKTIVSDAFGDTSMGEVLGLFSELTDDVFERLCTSDMIMSET